MGMGLFLHMIAKIVFVLVGYSIHMYLGKTLSAQIYGDIGVIMSIININYNFLSNGVRQTASHLIATERYNEKKIIILSYKYQLGISLMLFLINFSCADILGELINQTNFSIPIRLTAIMIPFTGLYFISVGILNGYKLLVYEAITVTIYPLARLSIILFVESGFMTPIIGTIAGFFFASVIGCSVGHFFILKKVKGITSIGTVIRDGMYAKQTANFLSFFICITIVLNLDMLFVNALVNDGSLVGYYTGATNLSKASYYLLTAIYIVALPIVTSAYSNGNIEKCKKTIQLLLMLIVSFILPIVSIIAPLSNNLMAVFYTEEYRYAALPTSLLTFSQFLLGIFVIFNILIYSASKKKFSVILGIVLVLLDAILCYILIPRLALLGAALSSLLINIIGVIFSSYKLQHTYGNVWNTRLSKLLFCNFILLFLVYVLGNNWITNNFFEVIVICIIIYVLYVSLLIKFKQIPLKEMIFERNNLYENTCE